MNHSLLNRMRLQLAIGCCMFALATTQFAWVLLHEGINAHWSHWLLAPWFWQ